MNDEETDMDEFQGRVPVRDIVSFFKFEQLTGNEESLNRWVVVPDVNRPGFELAGFYKMTEPRRIVIIGNKEQEFIAEMSEEDQRARFAQITDPYTPMMIITRNNPLPPILKEVAEASNFPIVRTDLPTYRLTVDLITYLDERLAPETSLPGVLISVYGKGVLITGESGMGKSEIALELIKRGSVLIADDLVDCQRIHNSVYGHAPAMLKGMLEIRGIGVIDVAKMFGASSLEDRFKVDEVINLVKFDPNADYTRIGDEHENFTDILDVQVPTITLPVKEGRNMGVIIESAVTNFRLQEGGFNSPAELKKRFREYLRQQEEQQKEKEKI